MSGDQAFLLFWVIGIVVAVIALLIGQWLYARWNRNRPPDQP